MLCPECEKGEMTKDDHVYVCPECEYETSELPAACAFCGATDEFWAWYGDPTRQTIDVQIAEDGTVSYDYTGVTDSGDGGSDDESFMCGNCSNFADTIEQLVGATIPPSAAIGAEWAIQVLTDEHDCLSPSTRDLLTLDGIKTATWCEDNEKAEIVGAIMAAYTGRPTRDPNELEGHRCECSDRGWWVIASDGDDSRDWVERCDDCRRFDTDDDAAEAAAEATGRTVGFAPLHEGTEDQTLSPRPYLEAQPDEPDTAATWGH